MQQTPVPLIYQKVSEMIFSVFVVRLFLVCVILATLYLLPLNVAQASTTTEPLNWWPRITMQLEKVFTLAVVTAGKIFSGEALQVAQLGRSNNELWTIETVPPVVSDASIATATRAPGTLVINAPLLIDTNLRVGGLTTLSTTTIQGVLTIGSLATERLSVTGLASVRSFRSIDSATIGGALSVRGGITTSGADIDLAGGQIFARNIVNTITAGDNITISGSANNPEISVDLDDIDLVTSLNGETGDIEFEEGDDISIDGMTIDVESTLDSVRSRGGCTACVLDGDIADLLTVIGGTIDNTIIGATTRAAANFTNVAVGSTSTVATLSVFGTLTTIGTATSTFGGGINITTGCYAVDGVCIAGAAPASYVGLTDTPSSLLAGALQFANASATALTQSSNLVFINDRFGIGTSTPEATLVVVGSSVYYGTFRVENSTSSEFVGGINVTGGCVSVGGTCLGGADQIADLSDVTLTAATTSDFLQYDGAVWRNVSMATLGFGDGSYVGLTDTPNSFVAGALQFANATSSALTQSAALTFMNDTLRIGTTSVATTLSVDGDISLVNANALRFYANGTSNYVGLRASSTVVTNTVWTLPVADGTVNQIMITDGNGNLSFEDVSAIGGGVTSYLDLDDTPDSFVAGALQYVHASGTYLTQSASLVFTGTNLGLGVSVPTERLSIKGTVSFVAADNSDGLFYNPAANTLSLGTTNTTDRLTILGGSIHQQGGEAATLYTPRVIGGVAMSDDVTDIEVVGSYAYAVSNSPGNDFHVIDLRKLEDPVVVSSLNFATNARAVAVNGRYAYAGTTFTGDDFHVIDVIDPYTPVEVASLEMSDSVNDIALAGHYAYIGTDGSGDDFHIINMRDPLQPVEVASLNLSNGANGVAIHNSYAYVVTSFIGNDFHVIDISNPQAPVEVASLNLPEAANKVVVSGGYAYVTSDATGDNVHIIDVTDPLMPAEIGGVDLTSPARGLSLAGKYLYVTSLSTGDELNVIDVEDPTNPVKVGGVDVASGDAYAVQVIGRYAYMTTGSGGDDFHVIDISGATLQSATIYSLNSGTLSVIDNAAVGGRIEAGLGIYAGPEGFQTDGSLLVTGTEYSYIASSLGIGTTSTSSKLTVAGSIESSDLRGGAVSLSTDANGVIIRDPSDERLKKDIVPIENALALLTELRGVRYEWRDKARFGDQIEIGFIAQEVDLILPEVVRKGGEYWSLNTKNMLAVVVEGVKEMWKIMQGHDERLIELESRVAELEAELEIDTPEETSLSNLDINSLQTPPAVPEESTLTQSSSTPEVETPIVIEVPAVVGDAVLTESVVHDDIALPLQ